MERVLALQRAGAGNHAISRVLARFNGDVVIEDVEDETEEAPEARGESEVGEADDGLPLLLTDRPWSEMFPPEPAPAPIVLEPPAPEEPEQDEAETEEAPDPAEKKSKKKRKKKKPGAATAPQGPAPQAPAATKPGSKAAGKQPKAPAPSAKAKAKAKTKAPQQQKAMTAAQKEHARKEKERLAKKVLEDAEDEKLDATYAANELATETAERAAQIKKLGLQRDQLTTARKNLPEGYDESEDLYTQAGDEVTALTEYLGEDGDGTTANSATLKARSDKAAQLLAKVKAYKPPLTADEIREKKWNEILTNVPNEFANAKWLGPKGGTTTFKVDKHDTELRTRIVNHFGKDQYEIPGHEAKTYPGRTPTSKVYYYVTGTSHTPYIAYDITAHVWDNGKNAGTVHVLHIPHET